MSALLECIDLAITISDLHVVFPLHAVLRGPDDEEIARSEPVEVVALGRTTHEILTRLS